MCGWVGGWRGGYDDKGALGVRFKNSLTSWDYIYTQSPAPALSLYISLPPPSSFPPAPLSSKMRSTARDSSGEGEAASAEKVANEPSPSPGPKRTTRSVYVPSSGEISEAIETRFLLARERRQVRE